MTLDKYNLEASDDHTTFEFFSEGPKGIIKKIIRFEKIVNQDNVYNLGFGDYNKSKDDVDDLIVSNNGDAKKILATVAFAFVQFTDFFPSAFVTVRGSTQARLRLYSMEISKYLIDIKGRFEIWEPFMRMNGNHLGQIDHIVLY